MTPFRTLFFGIIDLMNTPEEISPKKILLYAGAFNPPHNVRIETLVAAAQQEPFEEVWCSLRATETIKSLRPATKIDELWGDYLFDVCSKK